MTAADDGAHAASASAPEYQRLDATALAAEIRRGRITPLEALDAAIARSEATGVLNAIVHRDFDRARERAKALSAPGRTQRERQAMPAPLLGVPFALKDLGLSMQGTVTTHGCAFFRDALADHDSTLVQRHLAAGLNIFAKTTTPEFGQTATTESRLFGLTRNPWQLEHSPGGSSGGAAAIVAAGVVPVAHSTDGGGSIRIPASACGMGERFLGQAETRREAERAVVCRHLGEQSRVVRGVGNDRNASVILGCRAQHRRAADIDILDCVGERDVGLGDRFAEGVEIDADEVDGRDVVLRYRRQMFGQIAPGEDAAVHFRVQRLDATVEHFREAGVVADFRYGQPRLAQQFCRAARR